MSQDPWALARRIGLRNIAYLIFMVALAVLGLVGGARVAFLGGMASLVFLLVNLATLARAMGKRLPVLPSAIGVGLSLICGAALMEALMIQAG